MSLHLETLAIHAGQIPDPVTMSRAVPVYRTSAYNFRNAQHAADLCNLKEVGNIYGRFNNPTNDVLEQRLAALDRGKGALTFASGTAAIYFAITNIARIGDEIISANNLYGGTYTQFDVLLPQQGIKTHFTNLNDFDAVKAAINEKTRLIYIETVGNPGLGIADIEKYAEIARANHLPLVVDSTFTPPTLLRPIEHGANIVLHSISKWVGGHGTAIGGAVIDGGNFDWKDPKFALYNEPDRGYHDLRFAHDIPGIEPFIFRLRTVGLRNQGATLSPDTAWLFLQGLESLALRMECHSRNALAVAEFLSKHPKVAWVQYPSICQKELAKKYLPDGAGGMVVFGVKGGSKEAQKLVNNIKLFSFVLNVGDAKSLITHPASTTHSQLTDEQLREGGVLPELIRLSIGLEHKDDIIQALDEALNLI